MLALQREQAENPDSPPGRIYAAGPDWLLSTFECEGRFPIYRDVVPRSHSRFAVQRDALVDALAEVALTASEETRMVRLDLGPRQLLLTTASPGIGSSEAALPVEFLGGGDPVIHTTFSPAYLLDALKTLFGDTVVIDVDQNGCGTDGRVFSKPALVYAQHDPVTGRTSAPGRSSGPTWTASTAATSRT